MSRIQTVLEEHVYLVLREIEKSSLYDLSLACSKAWVSPAAIYIYTQQPVDACQDTLN